MARATIRFGRVRAYDEERGLGELQQSSEPGADATYRFHGTEISDGSRSIEPGTDVAFVLRAAPGGVFEAGSVTPIGRPAPAEL